VGTAITLFHMGPYMLLAGTWALHVPVVALTFFLLKSWKPVSSLSSLQPDAASTSWGADIFTVLSILSAVILLFSPTKGTQWVERLLLKKAAAHTSAKIGVLARSTGALSLELALLNAVHGRGNPMLMLIVRAVIISLSAMAIMWDWGWVLPHADLPKTVGQLASAVIVAAPALLSLPASIAELFFLNAALGHKAAPPSRQHHQESSKVEKTG
jgi:hypothetical protein